MRVKDSGGMDVDNNRRARCRRTARHDSLSKAGASSLSMKSDSSITMRPSMRQRAKNMDHTSEADRLNGLFLTMDLPHTQIAGDETKPRGRMAWVAWCVGRFVTRPGG